MEHILICTATMDKKVSSGINNFFSAAHAQNAGATRYKFSTATLENVQGYALMRNMASQKLLESPCDRLWFIDNDVIPPANVMDLLETDGDIVGASIPYAFSLSAAFLKLKDLNDLRTMEGHFLPSDQTHDVTCVGTACTIIRRHVLEDPRMHGTRDFLYRDGRKGRLSDDAPPPIFQFHRLPNGDINMGEDWDFCYRASKLGYRVRYDGRVLCDHAKTVGLLEVIEKAKQQWEAEHTASLSVA